MNDSTYQITNLLTEAQVAEQNQIVQIGRLNKEQMQQSTGSRNAPARLRPQASMKISSRKSRPDTGLFWDEPLDLYLDGTININLYNNVTGYMSGDAISGTIDIEIGQPFDATNLIIEFKGVERCHMGGDSALELEEFHREVKEIISMKQVLVQFAPGEILQPGQYSY